MEKYTDQDLLNELLEIDNPYPERHGGVTPEEYAQARGHGTRWARERLNRLVAEGVLRTERNQCGDRRLLVYYRVISTETNNGSELSVKHG